MFCFNDLKNMVFGVICLLFFPPPIISNLSTAYLYFAAPPNNLQQFPTQLLWLQCIVPLFSFPWAIKSCYKGDYLASDVVFEVCTF